MDVTFAVVEDESSSISSDETHTEDCTGVEMEALVGAATAAITIYDMCKAVDRGMVIGDLRLLEKTGGKEDYVRPDESSQAGLSAAGAAASPAAQVAWMRRAPRRPAAWWP